MTTRPETRIEERFRLPDPPPREPDEVTAFDHIYDIGDLGNLALHFGNPDTTLVTADRYIVASPEQDKSRARRPDLLIAFNVRPEDYRQSNGYISSEQGKPPDFVMEVASATTAETDTGKSGITTRPWAYRSTGGLTRPASSTTASSLAGDRLVGDSYVPIVIEEVESAVLEGFSEVLNLRIRWDHGQLLWIDPATNAPVPRHHQTIQRAERAEAERDRERARAEQAEERSRQLEEELRRLRESQGST